MGQELGPEYYDENMKGVVKPYDESPWREVYDTVVAGLMNDKSVPIIDIGCGTGRMAEALRRAGFTNYVGYDFSANRVAEARRYVPGFEFHVLDCFSDEAKVLAQTGKAFIITEVLEHIEKDCELLETIPSSALVLFSVPNYDSAGHVRTYPSVEHIIDRYGKLLNIAEKDAVELPRKNRPEKMIYVCKGTRR